MSGQPMPRGLMAIEARGLGKSYGVTWALRDVDLQVAAGEVVALFGANGAGKTTLLRLLATLTAPSLGTVRVAGMNAAGVAASRVRELSRGMRQRLALARCTIHMPAVLLLDEPESGLDADGSRCLSQLIKAGRERGQAAALAPHQLELGLALAQRVVILERGRIAHSASAGDHSPGEGRTFYSQSHSQSQGGPSNGAGVRSL